MDFSLEQTIAARASAAGPASRAIIRVSGPNCREIVRDVFSPDDGDSYRRGSRPGHHPGVIRLPQVHAALRAAAYLWPTSRSYTGQPLAELHVPGASPLVEATLHALFAAGAEPARAGEFTLRAFLAQRLDLLQAEAVLGVIDAADEDHLKASLKQLAGGISAPLSAMHDQLLLDLADLEAGLDFVDEDLEFVDHAQMRDRLHTAEAMLERLGQQAAQRMHVAPAATVVLAGLPNAGKSTLFNALLNRNAALVSSRSGTTRDYLTGRVTWDGRDIQLIDTAGCDADSDRLIRSASGLRDEVITGAQLVIWCHAVDLEERWKEQDVREQARSAGSADRLIPVTTKIDLAVGRVRATSLPVSAATGEGVDQLRAAVLSVLDDDGSHANELIGSTAARCSDSIRRAVEAVSAARLLLEDHAGDELVAAELRAAVDEIGRITGRIHSEDILDRIFTRFCIGK